MLIPMGLLWVAYTLVWYGYATLQQPTPGTCATCADGCAGFVDLIMPSKIQSVDNCIQTNWGKSVNFGGVGPGGVVPPPGPDTGLLPPKQSPSYNPPANAGPGACGRDPVTGQTIYCA